MPDRTAQTTWAAAWADNRLLILAANGDLLTLRP